MKPKANTKCISTRELALYMEGLPTRRTRTELDEHLACCQNCRTELREMKEMVELIGKVEYEPSEIRIPRQARDRCQAES
jgi:predicted anti-sigma-YlaC factor YlaD